ncbi:hypothetical protein CMUS01_12164 [Colletotrichum musicola]|uniref:Heterokaryon incompatibility domain-containing protein n=1 Tax=Colletotrichum musicola TaxID=2175873 RepID=A0A8H6N2I0_9PEZI|nr:hypothetical protein CMUS01_12164 [Colletotrichum musicola]
MCERIWSGLVECAANSAAEIMIKVGSFEEALSSTCSRHKPIFKWFRDLSRESDPAYDRSSDVSIWIFRSGLLSLMESTKHGGLFADLCLVRKESVDGHLGVARILDPEWIDTAVVDLWLKRCKSCHGASCENPMKIWRARPSWVIDTETRRLIPGEECDSFIALSYRWGRASRLHIPVDAISMLRRPYSLDDPAISSHLAPMVRHAIELTPVIGHRYIWVDTLCIDHSRVAESTRELQSMGAIYANATLTIVAFDGDAQDGFPGLRGISHAKNPENGRYVPFGEEQFIRDNDPTIGLRGMSPYHDRGWTYQEFHMSPRRLIFKNNSLHWFCQHSVWEEHLHDGVEGGKYIETRMGEIMRGMPNLESLGMLIQSYNDCTLAFDEDALPGVTGMLTVFSRCFFGGFICGIPEMLFEAALSWRPTGQYTNLRRRAPSNRPDSSQLHPSHLPSWSWIGWKGLVDVGMEEVGPAHVRHAQIRETMPITTWYASDSPKPSASGKRRIDSSWFRDRETYKDFERPLPPGWTRHTVPPVGELDEKDGEVLLYPDGCGKYTFLYGGSVARQEQDEWHWPFPVPEIQESTLPSMPEQSPFICCDTRRCRVSAFQAAEEKKDISLYSDDRSVIGSLRLHNDEQLREFPKPDADWGAAKEVELVAICRVRRHSKTISEETGIYTLPFRSWDAYVVLWVEWSDGVAYRLASGEVDKVAWEGLALEDVALVLG